VWLPATWPAWGLALMKWSVDGVDGNGNVRADITQFETTQPSTRVWPASGMIISMIMSPMSLWLSCSAENIAAKHNQDDTQALGSRHAS